MTETINENQNVRSKYLALNKAREIYKRLLETDCSYAVSSIYQFVSDIHKNLTIAERSYDGLDESGQYSSRDMRKALQKAVAKCHLRAAKQILIELENGFKIKTPYIIDDMSKQLQEHMTLAHLYDPKITLASLDRMGQASEMDMRNRINSAVIRQKHASRQEIERLAQTRAMGLFPR